MLQMSQEFLINQDNILALLIMGKKIVIHINDYWYKGYISFLSSFVLYEIRFIQYAMLYIITWIFFWLMKW